MLSFPTSKEDAWATWMLMQEVPGVGPGRLKSLHDQAGSLEAILDSVASQPSPPAWMLNLKEALANAELSKYKKVIELTNKCGAHICTLDDPFYPSNLKNSSTAPAILYYKGLIEDVSGRSLALVGTVTPTDLGIRRAEKFAFNCVLNGIQVISGLARGIDSASHKAALKYGGKTFAVIGHGIDHCYPSENKELFEEITKSGAVISQFPTGTKPSKWMFPARNETMCTLSSGTVIIEAHEKCGSLIQARYSFKHQRRVFVLNSNLDNENKWAEGLISQGAHQVKDFQIILKEMAEINKVFQKPIEASQMELFSKSSRKAFLFDMDGVLYDSISLMEQVYIDVVQELKGQVTERDSQIIKLKINNAPPYIFKSIGVDHHKGHDLYKRKYMERISNGISFFKGIYDLIKNLKERGYALGVVTSQPLSRYKAIISHAPFKELLDTAVTWNDVPKGQQKPHPAGIFKALEAVKVQPGNSAYIGDDPKDIQAAHNAGTKSVAALWGVQNPELLLNSKPDYIAKIPQDIFEIVF